MSFPGSILSQTYKSPQRQRFHPSFLLYTILEKLLLFKLHKLPLVKCCWPSASKNKSPNIPVMFCAFLRRTIFSKMHLNGLECVSFIAFLLNQKIPLGALDVCAFAALPQNC
jgi:hypothetical protein